MRATRDLAEALAAEGHAVRVLTDFSALPVPELRDVSIERLAVPLASGPFAGAALGSAQHNLVHAAAVYREVRRIHDFEQPVDAVLAPLWRSEGAICLVDDCFPTIVSCMTSLRTLTEVDGSYDRSPDLAQRLALEREALTRSRYLHGLTETVLSKTIRDYELRPAATAVIGRGLRDRAGVDAGEIAGDGKVRILSVGRMERRKGVDTLLAAARELVDDGVAVEFTFAGPNVDPSFRDSFEHDAAAYPQLGEAVRFMGAVSENELAHLLVECDIVCVPSRYESHGVVLIEAMMFGKPIVTCEAGGIGEVVNAGRNALVSPPEDPRALAAALRRLVDDAGLRGDLGAAARDTYECRFAARAVARQVEAFVAEVISIHREATEASYDVASGLEELVQAVLGVSPQAVPEAASELLDPQAGGPYRRLRAVALATTPPRSPARSPLPRITAVVLTRDRPGLLTRALDSLELSEIPLDVFVIDNNSAPAAARRVAEDCSGRAGVKLRRSDRNLGCAGGRRLGSELARTELVLFLDDDAELLPGAFEHLLSELDSHPNVGAVTATVVTNDGLVAHSGGSLELTAELASFDLVCAGVQFDPATLPPTGPAGWVPGTAVLVRRELLDAFPIDERMGAYYEDNEWCYRVWLARPGTFRRSSEALALHQTSFKLTEGESFDARSLAIEFLAACARFYERHGLLMGPAVFALAPQLRASDGTCDLASARVLMELLNAKGTDWALRAWMNGDLTGLLSSRRRQSKLRRAESEMERAKAEVAELRQMVGFLQARHETLLRVEHGGWWRLRRRVLPALRLAAWLRSRTLDRRGPQG